MADPNYFPGMDDESYPSQTQETPDKPDEEGEDDETALLPKSFFGGKTPESGSSYKIKVVRSYTDEVECSLEKESDSDDMHSKIGAMGTEDGGGY